MIKRKPAEAGTVAGLAGVVFLSRVMARRRDPGTWTGEAILNTNFVVNFSPGVPAKYKNEKDNRIPAEMTRSSPVRVTQR